LSEFEMGCVGNMISITNTEELAVVTNGFHSILCRLKRSGPSRRSIQFAEVVAKNIQVEVLRIISFCCSVKVPIGVHYEDFVVTAFGIISFFTGS
jgi:hypothetical protein